MQCFSFQEFEKAFKTLKHNKAIGCNRVNGKIIFGVNDFVKVILFKIFQASLEEAVFPEKLQKLFQFVEKVKNLTSLGINKPIYINNTISTYYKKLREKCKKLRDDKVIHAFWISNGSIRLKVSATDITKFST